MCRSHCTHVRQSVSGAAPDGRLGLSAHALAVAVLTVVLARLQLPNTTHRETKGLTTLSKTVKAAVEGFTWGNLAGDDVPETRLHEYVRAGRSYSAASVNLSCF